MLKYIPYNGLGGFEIQLTCDQKNNHPLNRLVTMKIPDDDLLEITKRGLERLAGQGKVDENLRAMCHCVGEPRGK